MLTRTEYRTANIMEQHIQDTNERHTSVLGDVGWGSTKVLQGLCEGFMCLLKAVVGGWIMVPPDTSRVALLSSVWHIGVPSKIPFGKKCLLVRKRLTALVEVVTGPGWGSCHAAPLTGAL